MSKKVDPVELMRERNSQLEEGRFNASRGGSSSFLNTPDGVAGWFKPEVETTYHLDFVPFVMPTSNNVEGIDEGCEWPRFAFFIHRNVGPESRRVVCPQSFGKSCPLCEERIELFQNGHKEAGYKLVCSYREVYLLLNENGEYMLYESAYKNFGKKLKTELMRRNDDTMGFFRLEGGYTLEVYYEQETYGGSPYPVADRIDFHRRDDSKFQHLDPEKAPDLAKVVNVFSYKELRDLHLGVDQEENEGTVTKVNTTTDDQEDDLPMGDSTSSSNQSDKTDQSEQTEQTESENECPKGHEFGVDIDEYEDCDECDKYKACFRELKRQKRAMKEQSDEDSDSGVKRRR